MKPASRFNAAPHVCSYLRLLPATGLAAPRRLGEGWVHPFSPRIWQQAFLPAAQSSPASLCCPPLLQAPARLGLGAGVHGAAVAAAATGGGSASTAVAAGA